MIDGGGTEQPTIRALVSSDKGSRQGRARQVGGGEAGIFSSPAPAAAAAANGDKQRYYHYFYLSCSGPFNSPSWLVFNGWVLSRGSVNRYFSK